jgi:hypothetical protein
MTTIIHINVFDLKTYHEQDGVTQWQHGILLQPTHDLYFFQDIRLGLLSSCMSIYSYTYFYISVYLYISVPVVRRGSCRPSRRASRCWAPGGSTTCRRPAPSAHPAHCPPHTHTQSRGEEEANNDYRTRDRQSESWKERGTRG